MANSKHEVSLYSQCISLCREAELRTDMLDGPLGRKDSISKDKCHSQGKYKSHMSFDYKVQYKKRSNLQISK